MRSCCPSTVCVSSCTCWRSVCGFGPRGCLVTLSPGVHRYKVIRHIFRDNRENEIKVAVYMDVFVHQLGFDLTAEETLTQLLTNNLQLLEQLQVEQVNVFLQFIRVHGKRPEFLDFLAALCSCLGRGVPANQELICDLIFGNGDGMMHDDSANTTAAAFGTTATAFGNTDATQMAALLQPETSTPWGDMLDVVGGADVILPTREVESISESKGGLEHVGGRDIPLEVFVGRLPSFSEFLNRHVGQESTRSILSTPKLSERQRTARYKYVRHIDKLLETAAVTEWVAVKDLYVLALGAGSTCPGGDRRWCSHVRWSSTPGSHGRRRSRGVSSVTRHRRNPACVL